MSLVAWHTLMSNCYGFFSLNIDGYVVVYIIILLSCTNNNEGVNSSITHFTTAGKKFILFMILKYLNSRHGLNERTVIITRAVQMKLCI